MNADYVEPFLQGVTKLLSTMLGEGLSVSEAPPADLEPTLTSIVDLSGKASGQLALSFPATTARAVVAAMLGADEQSLDQETVNDGAAEFANIVAGFAKARLAETPYHFQLSPPRHESGPWNSGIEEASVLRLSSAFGDFLLQVRLVPSGQ